MSDLAEHIGTVFWILSGLLAIVAGLIIYIWRDLKKEAGKFGAWHEQTEREGGVVTRSKYFSWCKESKETCPVHVLEGWRGKLSDEGGVLTHKVHAQICVPVVQGIRDMINECFSHNQELVVKDLEVMMAEVRSDRKTIDTVMTMVERNGNELVELRKSFEGVAKAQQRVLQELKIPTI